MWFILQTNLTGKLAYTLTSPSTKLSSNEPDSLLYLLQVVIAFFCAKPSD